MKNRTLITLFSLFLTLPALAQPQDDALEPPAQYELQINGKATPMLLDKEISLDTKAMRSRFLLSRGATRRFEKSGVKFDYPVDYSFEADLSDPKIAIWTLSGNNSLLMLQRFPLSGPALLREGMVRELTAGYGKKNVVVKPATLFFGGRQIEGKRLFVTLAKQRLAQEVFAFSNQKYAFVLMIQDAPQGGKESAETRVLKGILSGSSSY